MEFGKDRILEMNKTEDNFSDITFVAPYSVDNNKQTSRQSQKDQLVKEIQNNVWGCDLILCLFFAALNSYRSDRCLRPFPSLYINEDGKNFTALRKTCDNIPPINNILTEPKKCTQEVINLLIWLFIEKGHPILKRNSINFPSKVSNELKPHFIFELCYQEKVESLWKKRLNGRKTFLAYHGSAVDNFYSILKVGLQQHFSLEKDVLFGNGIYLSNELSLSANYSPFGQTWPNSALGSKHSVIALCEVINDVDKVKCRDTKNKKRAINEDSLGEIPEKYFVVTDSDMVRVKYLMVYRQKRGFSVKSYLSQHLLIVLLVTYLIFLAFIGFYNNSYYIRNFRKLFQIFSVSE